MIHTVTGNRRLSYSTPLIEYIRKNNLYGNENLIYTKKYSDGTFSITNPDSQFINCDYINGYPHFNIPLDVCLEEINFFLTDGEMYDNSFFIRYGDTHPHKPIPKLSQVRGLMIDDSLSSMIGSKAKSYYGFGDISIKTLDDFITTYGLRISPEELFISILNNTVPEEIALKYNEYDSNALEKLSSFIREIGLEEKTFLVESSLYGDHDLYSLIKNNPNHSGELKNNGELKYTLQELMFIKSILKEKGDVLFSIIGSNQSEHILKVNQLLLEYPECDNRFLSHAICRNGDERKVERWSAVLKNFIEKNNIRVNGRYITYQELLKILFIINGHNVILDFDKLDKHRNNILEFVRSYGTIGLDSRRLGVNSSNDLIHQMSLVGYNLNRAIEMGEVNYFYKYVVGVIKEYESNAEKYKDIKWLYDSFISKCFEKMGYISSEKGKVLIK